MQFFLALLVAAIARLWREASDLRHSLTVRTSKPPEIILSRLVGCRRCPIYFAPLATCGSPLRRMSARLWRYCTGKERPDWLTVLGGCDCHMPTKARIHANCWAYDRGLDIGWEAALNDFPPDEKA